LYCIVLTIVVKLSVNQVIIITLRNQNTFRFKVVELSHWGCWTVDSQVS